MTVYEIYDSRYIDHPEDATCFEVCNTLQEAIQNKNEYGDNNIIVKCMLKEVGREQYVREWSKIVKL